MSADADLTSFWCGLVPAFVDSLSDGEPAEILFKCSDMGGDVGDFLVEDSDVSVWVYGDVHRDDVLKLLPSNVLMIYGMINQAFWQYVENIGLDEWRSRIDEISLAEVCRLQNPELVRRKIEDGEFYRFVSFSDIHLFPKGEEGPCVFFEFDCPIEIYLSDYGFCALQKGEQIKFLPEDFLLTLQDAERRKGSPGYDPGEPPTPEGHPPTALDGGTWESFTGNGK